MKLQILQALYYGDGHEFRGGAKKVRVREAGSNLQIVRPRLEWLVNECVTEGTCVEIGFTRMSVGGEPTLTYVAMWTRDYKQRDAWVDDGGVPGNSHGTGLVIAMCDYIAIDARGLNIRMAGQFGRVSGVVPSDVVDAVSLVAGWLHWLCGAFKGGKNYGLTLPEGFEFYRWDGDVMRVKQSIGCAKNDRHGVYNHERHMTRADKCLLRRYASTRKNPQACGGLQACGSCAKRKNQEGCAIGGARIY